MRHGELNILVNLVDIIKKSVKLVKRSSEHEEEVIKESLHQPDREHALPVCGCGLEDKLIFGGHEYISIVGGMGLRRFRERLGVMESK